MCGKPNLAIMRVKIAILHFNSAIHLGYGMGEEYDRSCDVICSDTLSGALCSQYAGSGAGDVRAFMESYRVSSAMPILGGRLFLPLPPDKQCLTIRGDESAYKRLKALRWIEQPLWERLATEGSLEVEETMISHCGSAVCCGSGEEVVILKHALEQKVAIRSGEDADPFFVDKVFMGKGVAMAVIYSAENEAMFRKAFEMLADAGIGTDRSCGNGAFKVEFDELDIAVDTSITTSQILSMWIPQPQECSGDVMSRSCYKLVTRGGYAAGAANPNERHHRKRRINMVEGGAYVAAKCESLCGTIVDLNVEDGVDRVSHPIWRDGRVYSLPFKMSAYGKV